MSRSRYPSKLSLPQDCSGLGTVLDHLVARFPNVSRATWCQRMAEGKVHWHDGSPLTVDSRCRPQQRVYYYRELAGEPTIPFDETVLFEDEHILLADKPHFLPVTPGGLHVNECLQHRLRQKTGCHALQALHRLDRMTAGLVLFSKRPDTRRHYHDLFRQRRIEKVYHGVADVDSGDSLVGRQFVVRNRLEKAGSRLRMTIGEGESNSHSIIRCARQSNGRAFFELQPVTGRTHQLRVHMLALGWPLLNDDLYPSLRESAPGCYAKPLQLLAKRLRFVDPVTGERREFVSSRNLLYP